MQCFVYQELFLYSVLDFSTVFGTLNFFFNISNKNAI